LHSSRAFSAGSPSAHLIWINAYAKGERGTKYIANGFRKEGIKMSRPGLSHSALLFRIRNRFIAWRCLLAAAALLGCIWLVARPVAATTTINEYGFWASTVDTDDDGNRVCGVRTRMHGGGELRLLVIDGDVHLIAHDPDWNLRHGISFGVKIDVDDESHSGTGTPVDSKTLMVMNLSSDFLGQFIDGIEMVANFGGVRWTEPDRLRPRDQLHGELHRGHAKASNELIGGWRSAPCGAGGSLSMSFCPR
jgi:hypothetical protein